MDEAWLPVVGFEERYLVSDCGRVMSINGRRGVARRPDALRRLHVNRHGYYQVNLWNGHKLVNKLVHRLVLEAFVGPREQAIECRHKNANRQDNRLENLQYGTRAENLADAFEHGSFKFI